MSGPPPSLPPPIFQSVDPSKAPTNTASTTRRRAGPAYTTASTLLGGGGGQSSSFSSTSSSSLSIPPLSVPPPHNNDTNLTNGPPLLTERASLPPVGPPPLSFPSQPLSTTESSTVRLPSSSTVPRDDNTVDKSKPSLHTTPWTLPPPLSIPSVLSDLPPVIPTITNDTTVRSPSVVSPPFHGPSFVSPSSSTFTTPTTFIPAISTKSTASVVNTPSPLPSVNSTSSSQQPSFSTLFTGKPTVTNTASTVSSGHGGIPLPLSSSSSSVGTASGIFSSSSSSSASRFPSGTDLVKTIKPTPFAETIIGKSTLASVRSRRSSIASGNSSIGKHSTTSSMNDEPVKPNATQTVPGNGIVFSHGSLSSVPTPVTTRTEAPIVWPSSIDPESIADIIQKREDTIKNRTHQQFLHLQQPELSDPHHDTEDRVQPYGSKENPNNTTLDEFLPPSLSLEQLNETMNSTVSHRSLDTNRDTPTVPITQTNKPTVDIVRKSNVPVIKVQETSTASMFFTGLPTNATTPSSSVVTTSQPSGLSSNNIPSHTRKPSSFPTLTTNKDIFDKPPQPPNYAVIKAETATIKDPASAFFGASPGYTPVVLPSLPSTTVIVNSNTHTVEQPASFFTSGNADNGPSSLARFGVHVRTVSNTSTTSSTGSGSIQTSTHKYRTRTNSSRQGNVITKGLNGEKEENTVVDEEGEDNDTNVSSTVVSTSALFANAPATALDTLFSVPALVHQSPHQRYDNSYTPGFGIPPPLSPTGTHTYGGMFSQYPLSPVIPRSAMDFFATVVPTTNESTAEAVVAEDNKMNDLTENYSQHNEEFPSTDYAGTATHSYEDALYPPDPHQTAQPSVIYNGYYNEEGVWIPYDPYTTEYPDTNGQGNHTNEASSNASTYGTENSYANYTDYNGSLYPDTENGTIPTSSVEPWNVPDSKTTTKGAESDDLTKAMDFFSAPLDAPTSAPTTRNEEVPSKIAPWDVPNPTANATNTVVNEKSNTTSVAPWEIGNSNIPSVDTKATSSVHASTAPPTHVAPWDIGKSVPSASNTTASVPSVVPNRAPTPPLPNTVKGDTSAAKSLHGPPLSSHPMAPVFPSSAPPETSDTNPFTAVPSASLPSSKSSRTSRSTLAKGYVPTPFGPSTFNPTESNKSTHSLTTGRSLSPSPLVTPSNNTTNVSSTVSSSPSTASSVPTGPRGPHKPTLSASFGFGGRLVIFSNTSTKAHVYNVGDVLDRAGVSFYQSVKTFPGPLLQNGTPKKVQDYLQQEEKREIQRWQSIADNPSSDIDRNSLPYLSVYPLGLCGRSSPLHDLRFLYTVLNLLITHHGTIPVQSLPFMNVTNNNTNNSAESMHQCTEQLRNVLQSSSSMLSRVPEWVDNPILANAVLQAMAVSPVLGISTFPSSSPSTGALPDPERIQKMEQALIVGNKSLALEEAMTLQLWSHALLIAATISKESYQRTVMAFTVTNIPFTSSLASLYPALAGDIFPLSLPPLPPTTTVMDPQNSEHLSRALLLRNWRTHFLTLLHNHLLVDPRLLVNLGDRLWIEGGSVYGAHSLYLLAGMTTPEPPSAHARIVLIGADHRQHPGTFLRDISSLQRTEILEYARYNPKSPSNPMLMMMPSIQPIKLMYALVLADFGLVQEAFTYVQSIRRCIQQCIGSKLTDPEQWFQAVLKVGFNPMFLTELDVFEDRLRQTNRLKLTDIESKGSVGFVTGAVGSAFSGIKRLFSSNSNNQVSLTSNPNSNVTNNLSRRNSKDIGVAPGSGSGNGPVGTSMNAVPSITKPSVSTKTETAVVPEPITAVSTVTTGNTNVTTGAVNNQGSSSGLFSSIRGIFGRSTNGEEPKPEKRIVNLASDRGKQPYYDEQRKRWVIPGEEDTLENNVPLGPPPTASTAATTTTTIATSTVNGSSVPMNTTDDATNNAKTKKKTSRYFDPLAANSTLSSTVVNSSTMNPSSSSSLPPRYPNAPVTAGTNVTGSNVTPMMFTPPPSSITGDSNTSSSSTTDNNNSNGGGFGPAFQANSRLLQQAVTYSASSTSGSSGTNTNGHPNSSKGSNEKQSSKPGVPTDNGTSPSNGNDSTVKTTASPYDNFNFGASFSVGATAGFGSSTSGTKSATGTDEKNENIWEF